MLCARAVLVSFSSEVSSEPWGGRLARCPSWTEMQCATRDASEFSMPGPAKKETATKLPVGDARCSCTFYFVHVVACSV